MRTPRSWLSLGALLAACGAPASTLPADAAPRANDAAPPASSDDGAVDAAAEPPPDAPGTDAPPPACVELGAADPWRNLLGGHTVADRGQLLQCVHVASFSREAASRSPYFSQHGWTADNGFDVYVVEYVSEGSPGEARAVTALLYLPQGTAPGAPVVAVDHGTTGMGPLCGPTRMSAAADYMAVPLVGRGYAVVATDYAGMGVDDGVSPYLVGDAEAAGALDGLRALRRFRDGARWDAARLGADLFVMGHSQGGQAALFTHQRYDNALGFTLRGTIAYAPALGDIRGLGQGFSPSLPVSPIAVFMLMGLYGNMTYHHAPDLSTWLTPRAQSAIPGMLHDQCLAQLFTNVPALFPSQGELFSPGFLAAAHRCVDPASCAGFAPWAGYLTADVPGDFASSVPVLLVQGERDTLVQPAGTACVAQRLAARGTPVRACGYADDDHLTVVGSAMGDTLRWMAARRHGETPNVCPAPLAERCP